VVQFGAIKSFQFRSHVCTGYGGEIDDVTGRPIVERIIAEKPTHIPNILFKFPIKIPSDFHLMVRYRVRAALWPRLV
jgi:hypothetical protein